MIIKPKRLKQRKRSTEGEIDISDLLVEGFSLDKDLKGEIITVTLAPNEFKIISHGLRAIPLYRIILRQLGNAVIDDYDNSKWTDKTFALRNNSANSVTLTIKLFPG